MGALIRGFRNPGRNPARSALVVLLLSVIIGVFVLMVQAATLTRQQLSRLEARVRTLIELREAGAFGIGGFGGDTPIGEQAFSVATLEKVNAIPDARYLARIDEYVYTPQIALQAERLRHGHWAAPWGRVAGHRGGRLRARADHRRAGIAPGGQ